MESQEQQLRKELIHEAKSLNNNLTDDFLEDKDTKTLLCYAHPSYRDGYQTRLNKINEDAEKEQCN